MPDLLPTDTSRDVAARASRLAVLPVGSFEQHGEFLPLTTDTLIAAALAHEIAEAYDLTLLPPITIGCSHEHAGFPGTVSISATTLHTLITDVAQSLKSAGVNRLLVVNGHGGNYVLSNVVQEASTAGAIMALFPARDDWRDARVAAGMQTDNHDDMHAGELETSILLHAAPAVVRPGFETADHTADDRRHMLSLGLRGYTTNGVIGRPSLATAEKGKAVLGALTELAKAHVEILLGEDGQS